MSEKPHFLLKEHIDYRDKINQLLKTLPAEKLKEIYNILTVMNK